MNTAAKVITPADIKEVIEEFRAELAEPVAPAEDFALPEKTFCDANNGTCESCQ